MDFQSKASNRKQDQEFSINPWKLDLVSNYFQPKEQQVKVVRKLVLSAEDSVTSPVSDCDAMKDINISNTEGSLNKTSVISSSQLVMSPKSVTPSTTKPSLVKRGPKGVNTVSANNIELCTATSKQEKHAPVSVLNRSRPKTEEISSLVTQKSTRDAQSYCLASTTVLIGSDEVEAIDRVAIEDPSKCQIFQGGSSSRVTAMKFTGTVVKAGGGNKMLVDKAEPDDQVVLTCTENNIVDSDHVVPMACSEKLDKTVDTDSTNTVIAANASDDKSSNIAITMNQAVQCGLADAGAGRNSSPICSSRPALVKKPSPLKQSQSPTNPSPSNVSQDRGSTCVSVILKSSRLMSKVSRLSMIAKKQREVEQLVSSYSLKFCHKSSPGVQVRLDYCFLQPEQARKFFKAVLSLSQSQTHTSPKMVTCILFSEEELGYQHEPVLTEHDLLAIQSPDYCRNIFRTPVLIRAKMMNDVVVYEFKNVTDVNKFLCDKSSSVKTRALGLLRKNVVPKKMMTDEHGYYRLFSAGPKIPDSIGQKHRFRVDGPFLLFRSKLDLFAFLISDDAAGIDHLQFFEEKIKDLLEPNEDEYDENKHEAVVEPTKNFENAHEFNLNITKESKSESETLRERNFDLKDTKLKAATCEEVALRNELSKVDMAVHDTCSNKSSDVETVKVPDEDKNMRWKEYWS